MCFVACTQQAAHPDHGVHCFCTGTAGPLPPPLGPPPGFSAGHLPPPMGPPPGMMMARMPSPMMPLSGYAVLMPPPPGQLSHVLFRDLCSVVHEGKIAYSMLSLDCALLPMSCLPMMPSLVDSRKQPSMLYTHACRCKLLSALYLIACTQGITGIWSNMCWHFQ